MHIIDIDAWSSKMVTGAKHFTINRFMHGTRDGSITFSNSIRYQYDIFFNFGVVRKLITTFFGFLLSVH